MRYDVACDIYTNTINVDHSVVQEAYERDDMTDAVPPLLRAGVGARCELSAVGDFRSCPGVLLFSPPCACCSRNTWAIDLVGSKSNGFSE